METSLFCCPLCGRSLARQNHSLYCEKGHCFDLSKEGYANLLPVGQKHAKFPGDDPGMVAPEMIRVWWQPEASFWPPDIISPFAGHWSRPLWTFAGIEQSR